MRRMSGNGETPGAPPGAARPASAITPRIQDPGSRIPGVARGEVEALLHLRLLPGLSDRSLRELLKRYGSARAVLSAPAAELGEVAAAARGDRRVLVQVERAVRLLESGEVELLVESDPRYPARLLDLCDPPPLLFARGRLELLERPALAIVGSRRPTTYGRDAARALAAGVSGAGVVVVSGMARGIDGEAHGASLDGGTIGVLGCGIDVVYPREHARLIEEVASRGLLLSEFPPGAAPLRYHFPQRNRLIAALSLGVLVVEASRASGSLITVEHALDLGREVFAVPGPIGRETSAGSNELIRDGATMVLGVGDILSTLGLPAPATETPPEGAPESVSPAIRGEALRLWQVLDDEPRHADELAAVCGLDAATTLVRLLELELGGHARQLSGQRFVRAGGELVLG